MSAVPDVARRLVAVFERLVDALKGVFDNLAADLRCLAGRTGHVRNEAGVVRVAGAPRGASVTTRVQAGVALLDERRPGWDRDVNPGSLRVESALHCVLGQTYGAYEVGLGTLGLSTAEARRYGFNSDDYSVGLWHDYAALNREWAAEVVRRQRRKV